MTLTDFSNRDISYKITISIALMLLVAMSWNSPISGDEHVHLEQARNNIRYLKTMGADKEALNTPISRLKHYGQSFDTITTLMADFLGIENPYRFRHVSNALMAWLIILFTSLTAIHLTRSGMAGVFAVLLMLVSARFMGHAMNNLKDIPFALSFICSIYFTFRFLDRLPAISWKNIIFIILGIAFGISIRIGGLLIIAFFILFTSLWVYFSFQRGDINKVELRKLVRLLPFVAMIIIVISWLLGILLWPWALESPVLHPLKSLALMIDYPTTVRQVFEGHLYWSDSFPWYYLFKYVLITTPVIVLMGFLAFLFLRIQEPEALVKALFLLIAFGFPLFYAATTGANVYGGWRQMLFVYPPFVVLAALGLWSIYRSIRSNRIGIAIGVSFLGIFLSFPSYFIIKNYPYQYIYFNALVGGTYGAYGNYELDYYFTSFKKAYQFIDTQLDETPKVVAANFIIPEYYKDKPYRSALIDYYNRSAYAWDYAVVCNTFLNPAQLKNGNWPPKNTVYTIDIEGRPILAIIKRVTHKDIEGIIALTKGDYTTAITLLSEALNQDTENESILLNLARAHFYSGDHMSAVYQLERLEEINPGNEWSNDIRGEILMKEGNYEAAIALFSENLRMNYKFFHSYVNLAKAYLAMNQEENAIEQLKTCLRINPFYQPAYKVYGALLIERGETELGRKMLDFKIEGNSKYGSQ
jgi:tetratricopeptide (TPR) repeat protein